MGQPGIPFPSGRQLVSEYPAGHGVGSGFPTPISGSDVQEGNFQLLDYQDAAVVSDTSFTLYNNSAKELAQRQHSQFSRVENRRQPGYRLPPGGHGAEN